MPKFGGKSALQSCTGNFLGSDKKFKTLRWHLLRWRLTLSETGAPQQSACTEHALCKVHRWPATGLCHPQGSCKTTSLTLTLNLKAALPPMTDSVVGGVPTTPDPNTSAKVSRYRWETYRDTNWCGVYTTFCQEEGILLQKYRDRNGRCIAILFKSIGVWGRFDSPDVGHGSSGLLLLQGQCSNMPLEITT